MGLKILYKYISPNYQETRGVKIMVANVVTVICIAKVRLLCLEILPPANPLKLLSSVS